MADFVEKRNETIANDALEQATAARSRLTEREKMLRGEAYLAMDDPELTRARLRTRRLQQAFITAPWPEHDAGNTNEMPDFYGPERRKILEELFGLEEGAVKALGLEIEPPFFCDYGTNINFTGPFYCNFNCVILDCAQVTIGSRVMFAPSVHIYAATHSTDVAERRAGLERAYPVTIGDDVWVGGGARIIGPCEIGDGVTLAANSVARGKLEPYCVYAGVPARLVKRLPRPQDAMVS